MTDYMHYKRNIALCGLVYLESFSINVCWLWHSHKTDKKVFAEVRWCRNFKENVHENFEAREVNFL